MPDAFSRERMLLGEAAVQRLRESHVIVFGLGGGLLCGGGACPRRSWGADAG